MLLLLHILSACSSLTVAAFGFFSPTAGLLRLSGLLIGSTLVSGTLLVVSRGSHLLESCLMGLAYLAITLAATYAGHRKLAAKNG